MRIAFEGLSFVRRVVGPYTWDSAAPVQEVAEAALAAELLTTPATTRGRFVVAPDEPLLADLGLTPDQIIALALEANVASAADLAAVRPSRALADALAAPLPTLKRLAHQARAHTTPPQEA